MRTVRKLLFFLLPLLFTASGAHAQSAMAHMTASATVVEPASVTMGAGRFWTSGASVQVEGALTVGGRTRAITRVESKPIRLIPGISTVGSSGRTAAAAPVALAAAGTEQMVRGSVDRLPGADEAVSYRVELLN
jgi:hypothetical protein